MYINGDIIVKMTAILFSSKASFHCWIHTEYILKLSILANKIDISFGNNNTIFSLFCLRVQATYSPIIAQN